MVLDKEGLVVTWQDKLEVVNCAGFPGDVLEHGVYICPAKGASYSHRRCQYFGMYGGNKRVERVALIRAVVDVVDATSGLLRWKNVADDTARLEQEAVAKVRMLKNQYPMRAFLLGELYPTLFLKNTPGGLYGTKIYFDLSAFKPADAREVANLLYHKDWTAVPRW